MFLVSLLVLGVVFYATSGRELPSEVVDQLNQLVPDDMMVDEHSMALAFMLGMFIAGTPLHTAVRYLSTVVHELGHAFSAGVLGGRPKQITINLNASGLATYYPPPTWGRLRATIVSLAGYPAPAIASLAAVRAAQTGHPKAWFAFSVGTLAVSILLLIRNFWGFLWTAGVVGGSYYGARQLDVEILGWVVGAVAGYLAVEGYRNAWQQLTLVRLASGSGCDAEMVAYWWRTNAKFIAWVHLIVVLAISGFATKMSIGPYWNEILEWVQKYTET